MKDLITPKQVARAIHVSESSVKRWCDRGMIPTQYTGGGHRRIPLHGLLAFLKSTKYELRDPEVLGLPATTGRTVRVVDRAAGELTAALMHGDEQQCRQIVLDLYLAGHGVAVICDQVLAESFRSIGNCWQSGGAEVYQERRGCEIARRVLHELRMLASPSADAPVAIGGSVEGDQYNLATSMVELVLRDANWNAVSLGENLPFGTLAAAIKEHRPRLFWLSISCLVDERAFLRGYAELFDTFGADAAFVVGGRALQEPVRQRMKYAVCCDTLQQLAAYSHGLRADIASP